MLWEVLKCEIRAASISYSSWKSKKNREYGKLLETTLIEIEKEVNSGNVDRFQELKNAKEAFAQYNDKMAQGIFIRSRSKYIEEGEKCTKYFNKKREILKQSTLSA